ncbi:MAG: fimbrillin family protein, partial [Muribaculaceae bacterium]|nr:fimbrillin family protein [Muribaculaceae bacterium]
VDDTQFTLTTPAEGQNLTAEGYSLSGFRIPGDIASHFDFVTGTASGQLLENETTGVDLKLKHQLSRIELKAWGESQSYSLEIAGVRLGGVGVGGDFSFNMQDDAAGESAAANWTAVTKGNVDYIFREGDKIVTVHNTPATDAAYLLRARIAGEEGAGGKDNSAMVIPGDCAAWAYKDNPENTPGGDKDAGMYISVLLRISDNNSGDQESVFYPSDPIPEKVNVIYLAVDTENTVKAQLYKQGEKYFTDSGHTVEYDPVANSAEVKTFGWAALPVEARWKPGLVYTYTLNYTAGVGLHDPEDPNPGTPVISDGLVVNVEINKWERTDESAVTVPRK